MTVAAGDISEASTTLTVACLAITSRTPQLREGEHEQGISMGARVGPSNQLSREQKRFSKPCGPAPLADGEDAARYQRLLAGVVNAVKPTDVPEWLWVRDIVDLEWEILRYRSAKAHLISSAEESMRRDPNFDEASGASSMIAHAVAHRLTDLRRLDLMLMSMEYRRDNAYREIEHRRANPSKGRRLGSRMRTFAPPLIEDHLDE